MFRYLQALPKGVLPFVVSLLHSSTLQFGGKAHFACKTTISPEDSENSRTTVRCCSVFPSTRLSGVPYTAAMEALPRECLGLWTFPSGYDNSRQVSSPKIDSFL